MPVRYPAPLRPGDRIGVTAPSSGVAAPLRPRLAHAAEVLRSKGYEVVLGDCLDGEQVTSASPQARADELMSMLLDPLVRAVVPPWGGELAVEVLPLLDLTAVAEAEPTWVVGYSDISTLLLPLTTVAGIATLHGPNLMDTPYDAPKPLLHWLDVATAPVEAELVQGPSEQHRSSGFDRWEDDPTVSELTVDSTGTWRLLDGDDLSVTGRLIGGCTETVSVLAGTPYGDLAGWTGEPLVLYLEACEEGAVAVARHLWRMRLAGWFDRAAVVLVGRTNAPATGAFSQQDAVRSVLGDLDVPVVLDVDCGHVPPQLSLVNGALAEVTFDGSGWRLVQHLR
jgi:muramoyltetrapeptide carboxypeptidase